jgi:hypothetical protein
MQQCHQDRRYVLAQGRSDCLDKYDPDILSPKGSPQRANEMGRTMNVHPTLADLYCPIYLYLIHALSKTRENRLMHSRTEFRCAVTRQDVSHRSFLHARDSRFSLKSANPIPSSPSFAAGNHPIIVHESTRGGGVLRNDRAYAGRVRESGFGGASRW